MVHVLVAIVYVVVVMVVVVTNVWDAQQVVICSMDNASLHVPISISLSTIPANHVLLIVKSVIVLPHVLHVLMDISCK